MRDKVGPLPSSCTCLEMRTSSALHRCCARLRAILRIGFLRRKSLTSFFDLHSDCGMARGASLRSGRPPPLARTASMCEYDVRRGLLKDVEPGSLMATFK